MKDIESEIDRKRRTEKKERMKDIESEIDRKRKTENE